MNIIIASAQLAMTDNLILEKISQLEVGVVASYIMAAIAIIVLAYRAFRRSDSQLGAWYKSREQRRQERKMIYETAESLKELEKNHESDISKLNARFDEVLDKIDSLSSALEKQKELNYKNKQRELRNDIITMYETYGAGSGHTQWNDDVAAKFWELIDLYEEYGGNGYVHEVIVPYMRKLEIVAK